MSGSRSRAPAHPREPTVRLQPRLRAVLVALALCLPLCLPPTLAHATGDPIETGPPAAGQTLSGVIDHGPATETAAFGTWRGKPVDVISDFLSGSTWSSIENVGWMHDRWAGVQAHYVLGVFMLPTNEPATVQDCAAQKFNAHYEAAGRALVAAGFGNSTLRLGWEFTGPWFKWGWHDNQQWYYATCYRTMVRSLRKAPGQSFTFDWNLSDQQVDPLLGKDPSTCASGCGAYPGDTYVDYVSADFYDSSAADPADHLGSWSRIQTGPRGLDWLASFAALRGKRIGLPEWGVSWRCSGGWYGGDDPYYVFRMHEWIKAHDVAYESIFNEDDNSCQQFSQASGHFPVAYDLYRLTFGAAA
jgi:hypothetical protein